MQRMEEGNLVRAPGSGFSTRRRMVLTGAALTLAALIALPAVEAASERSYIQRCVKHRADTCGDDYRDADAFCTQHPLAYADDPAPVQHASVENGPYVPEAQKAHDRCMTAWLYHHRNDGLFGGLIRF